MPVTVKPSPEKVGVNDDPTNATHAELFEKVSKIWTLDIHPSRLKYIRTNKRIGREDRKVLQSSFADDLDGALVVPYGNGFVTGIMRAFNQDLHLVLRPDDVWLAVLTQFSMYVNGNAEKLRSLFVSHQGKKTVTVDFRPLSVFEADFGRLALEMTKEMQHYIVDEELQEWMVPNFTTTTDNDVAVSSFVMMGCLQSYFEYIGMGGCGFPSVTLLGERADWESLERRAARLVRYGEEARQWSELLLPVLRNMIRTFDNPDSPEIKDFWLRACYEAGMDGSGGTATLSGWITAFCFWDEEGKRNTGYSTRDLLQYVEYNPSLAERRPLTLDGVSYPMLSPKSVPKAVVSVPVVLRDAKEMVEYTTTVVAGHVGMTLTDMKTMVQPMSGWWMLLDSSKPMSGLEDERDPSAVTGHEERSQKSGGEDCVGPLF